MGSSSKTPLITWPRYPRNDTSVSFTLLLWQDHNWCFLAGMWSSPLYGHLWAPAMTATNKLVSWSCPSLSGWETWPWLLWAHWYVELASRAAGCKAWRGLLWDTASNVVGVLVSVAVHLGQGCLGRGYSTSWACFPGVARKLRAAREGLWARKADFVGQICRGSPGQASAASTVDGKC